MTAGVSGGVPRTMRLLTCALALTLAALAYGVEPASACSCAIGDPRTRLAQADAAFVGRFVEKREPSVVTSSADDAVYVFRVERAIKGRLPATIEIVSAVSGASCGLEVSPGQRIGLFLRRAGSGWRSGLCDQIDPAQLIAAARPLPRPAGRGPLAFLVGGKVGHVRTLGLDARGRTLAYGSGRGEVVMLAPCPGSHRVVEYASAPTAAGSHFLAVRDLRTFRITRERRHRPHGHGSVAAISCLDRNGSVVAIFETAEVPRAAARLIVGGRVRWRGRAPAATFAGRHAYLAAGIRATALLRVDLESGRVTRLAPLPQYTTALRAGPRGRVAAVAYSAPLRRSSPPSRVVLYDPRARPIVRTAPLGQSNVSGDVDWWRGKLVFLPQWNVDAARVYDANLRVVARFGGWPVGQSLVRGDRAYGLARGQLFSAALPRGPARVLRRLPGPVTYALAVTPGAARVRGR